MKKSERLLAEKFLLQCIYDEDKEFVEHTMQRYGVSKSTVYNYLTTLQNAGEVERVGGSMPYRVTYRTTRITVDPTKERSEDRLYAREIAPLLEDLPPRVQKVWRYAVTAMLNNALEHSRASAIVCVVSRNRLNTIVGVLDNGTGIFRRIQQDVHERTGELLTGAEAAAMLFAGKYTGAPESHAGEGIFFVSRLMDHFAIRSELQLFTAHDEEDEEVTERFRGTAVQMALANDAEVDLGSVMCKYVDAERGFVRTEIPVYRFFGKEAPLSRSEARRLVSAISAFEVVELDFADVQEIGHDFAHELFTVQLAKLPTLRLRAINAISGVENALRRAGYRE